MLQAASTNQEIGTAQGHRAIMFCFETTAGKRSVTLDFYGNGSNLNGRRYVEAPLQPPAGGAGLEVTSYTHVLIK